VRSIIRVTDGDIHGHNFVSLVLLITVKSCARRRGRKELKEGGGEKGEGRGALKSLFVRVGRLWSLTDCV
jgi:hypothetical protein